MLNKTRKKKRKIWEKIARKCLRLVLITSITIIYFWFSSSKFRFVVALLEGYTRLKAKLVFDFSYFLSRFKKVDIVVFNFVRVFLSFYRNSTTERRYLIRYFYRFYYNIFYLIRIIFSVCVFSRLPHNFLFFFLPKTNGVWSDGEFV